MKRKGIMRRAWAMARLGAERFGGSVKQYFAMALKFAWEEAREKPRTCWTVGLGKSFVLPGVPIPTSKARNGNFVLPGIHFGK